MSQHHHPAPLPCSEYPTSVQERELLACRSFYPGETDDLHGLSVGLPSELFRSCRTRIPVKALTFSEVDEIIAWNEGEWPCAVLQTEHGYVLEF